MHEPRNAVADPVEELDALNARVCEAQREMFRAILRADQLEVWRDSGARDMVAWRCIRYGLAHWKALRWLAAARALESLPVLSASFASGAMGIDKVVELARFATPESEARLIGWAQRVSIGAVRNRGDLAARQSIREVREAERFRSVSWWWFDEGRRFGLEADLPAAQGAVVARALTRLAETIPVMPGEEDPMYAEARRADALVALASNRIASDADSDRATVVVHAQVVPGTSRGAFEIEGGPVIHPRTAERLLCHSRIQVVAEDAAGNALGMAKTAREPSAALLRQLRHRDFGCTFPGCGSRRFAQAHHIRWWSAGGRTELGNLALVCSFHHRLVHEHGWTLKVGRDGIVRWRRPDGTRYRAGPAGPPGSPDRASEDDRTVARGSSGVRTPESGPAIDRPSDGERPLLHSVVL